MNERRRNLAVGTTALIGLIGVLVMLWLFGNVQGWFTPGYQVMLHLPNAGGLTAGNRVYLSGIEVGRVENVALRNEVGTGVSVQLLIRDEVRVPKEAQARIQSRQLIGGQAAVALDVPEVADPDELETLPTDGTAVLRGQVPTLAGTLTQELQTAMDRPMSEFERIADSFQDLSEEWRLVGENLNVLIEPRPASVEGPAGEQDPNIATVLGKLDARLSQMQTILSHVNRYVEDDEIYEDVRLTARNARELTQRVNESVEQLTGAVNENVDVLSRRYVALADDMSGAVRSMERLVGQASEGEGTMARLVNDPALYDNLNDTAERMQTAVDELRLLIQKWQAEGVPVQF